MFSLLKKADYETAARIKEALNIATTQVETRRTTRKITKKTTWTPTEEDTEVNRMKKGRKRKNEVKEAHATINPTEPNCPDSKLVF